MHLSIPVHPLHFVWHSIQSIKYPESKYPCLQSHKLNWFSLFWPRQEKQNDSLEQV